MGGTRDLDLRPAVEAGFGLRVVAARMEDTGGRAMTRIAGSRRPGVNAAARRGTDRSRPRE